MKNTRLFTWVAAVLASKLVKLSLSLGSYAVGLSGITVTLPLMGRMFGLTSTCIVAGALGTLCACFTGLPLTFGIPSIAATLSWACSAPSTNNSQRLLNFLLHCILPLTCMAIFMTHPVGGKAWYYALYWLVPVVIWALRSSTTFLHALQSTFIAHALGAIIWLLTGTLTADQWTALVPAVAFERLMIAGLSTCVWYGIQRVAQQKSSLPRRPVPSKL
ncbi:MAG: hypothetical protein WCW33_01125 [Candidatus Babeliales bacterium]|jgi:hypothetical protein